MRRVSVVGAAAVVGMCGSTLLWQWSAVAQSDVKIPVSGARIETKTQPLEELPLYPAVAASNLPKKLPPAFPSMGVGNRPGATKIFENDKIIVWDDVFGDGPTWHRHTRDAWAIHLEHGMTRLITPDGQDRVLNYDSDEHMRTHPGIHAGNYVKAGIGPHVEFSGTNTNRRHMMWVEFKGTEPADCKEWSTDPLCK